MAEDKIYHSQNPYVYQAYAGDELIWRCELCRSTRGGNGKASGIWKIGNASCRIKEHHLKKHPNYPIVHLPCGGVSKPTPQLVTVPDSDVEQTESLEPQLEPQSPSLASNISPTPITPRTTPQKQARLTGIGGKLSFTGANMTANRKLLTKHVVRWACSSNIAVRSFQNENFSDMANLMMSLREPIPTPCRRTISNGIVEEANLCRSRMLSEIKGQSVILLADGGTLNRKRLINFSIASNNTRVTTPDKPKEAGFAIYFWKSVELGAEGATSSFIVGAIDQICEELGKHDVRVVGMCSDNASNFVAAGRAMAGTELDSAGNEDDDESDVEIFEEDEPIDDDLRATIAVACEEIMQGDQRRYFVHIRCWAHSFQLLLNDMFKMPKLANIWAKSNKYIKLITPTVEAKIRDAAMKAGDSRNLPLVKGAVTRWNSKIEAMLRLYDLIDFFPDLGDAFILEDPTQFRDEILATCTLLFPICYATQEVQGDNVTLIDALPVVKKLEASYKALQAMPWHGRAWLRELIARALEAIQVRMNSNFSNMAVRHLEFFTPPFAFKEDHVLKSTVAAEIAAFFSKKVVNEQGDPTRTGPTCAQICAELNSLANMQVPIIVPSEDPNAETKELLVPSRVSLFRNFWSTSRKESESVHGSLIYVPHYVRTLESFAVTEAAVERSFSVQGNIMSGSRNRIKIDMVNCTMIVHDDDRRVKARRLEAERGPMKTRHRLSLSIDDFLKNVAYYRHSSAEDAPKPAHMKVKTRSRTKVSFSFGDKIYTSTGGPFALTVILDERGLGPNGNPVYNAQVTGQGNLVFDPSVTVWTPQM